MFQRLIYQGWQLVFPIVALVVAAAVFGVMTWCALHLKRAQVERLARLPLEDDGPAASRGGSQPAGGPIGRTPQSPSITP